jgi:hypothetical protein
VEEIFQKLFPLQLCIVSDSSAASEVLSTTYFYLSYFDKLVDFRCGCWSNIVKVLTNIGDTVRTNSSCPNKVSKFTCVAHVCQVYAVQLVAHAY